ERGVRDAVSRQRAPELGRRLLPADPDPVRREDVEDARRADARELVRSVAGLGVDDGLALAREPRERLDRAVEARPRADDVAAYRDALGQDPRVRRPPRRGTQPEVRLPERRLEPERAEPVVRDHLGVDLVMMDVARTGRIEPFTREDPEE